MAGQSRGTFTMDARNGQTQQYVNVSISNSGEQQIYLSPTTGTITWSV